MLLEMPLKSAHNASFNAHSAVLMLLSSVQYYSKMPANDKKKMMVLHAMCKCVVSWHCGVKYNASGSVFIVPIMICDSLLGTGNIARLWHDFYFKD